jgi:phage-related tail fiber protein
MKTKVLWALIALNLTLFIALLGRAGSDNAAIAQARRPSNYLMIPADITGGSSGVVYLLDTTTGVLGGMSYDDAGKQLSSMPPLDLNRVFEAGAGIGTGRRGGGATGAAGGRPRGGVGTEREAEVPPEPPQRNRR